jgi:transposase-like protein
MVKCPKCGSENAKPTKEWKYALFQVKKFDCQKCKAKFRDYSKQGKHNFTLIYVDGVGYRKPKA